MREPEDILDTLDSVLLNLGVLLSPQLLVRLRDREEHEDRLHRLPDPAPLDASAPGNIFPAARRANGPAEELWVEAVAVLEGGLRRVEAQGL